MKKYLMTVLAAVALGGMFSGCSKEIEGIEGGNSAAFDVVQNYEAAFITRFGQPAETQTWGFGKVSASTRSVVDQPSVTEIGYTFNATMAKAWEGVVGTSTVMANYTSWRNSGWNDKFYQVNGSVVPASIDATLREKAYTAILEKIPEGGPGGGANNLATASATGYSIVTKGGPVTLTPIYHNSSSGDMISYYYYPQGTNPDVKTLPKYTIGNMADPQECSSSTGHTALNESTYSLVYVGENGPTYEFPENYVINFMVSNTDLSNQPLTIADDKIIAQKDWTGEANLPGFVQFADNQGSAQMENDGIAITVNYTSNYWQPQLSVLDGFNLKAGVNYKVAIVAKFPGDGQLQINMGNWDNNKQYNFPVKATGDFQEVVCEFPQNGDSYGADVSNAHVLFQCGNFRGKIIVKSVKVIEESGTKTIANTPEFYGDGAYNTEVHQSTIPLFENVYHWAVNPPETPHIAVFNTEYTDNEGKTVELNLIGFEDWTDLDFNDVIFAVTGTRGGEEIEIEEPDPEPICRIITEDLNAKVGENDDFDFNDVVFDVLPNEDGVTTTLIIRCIGGELPLYIGQSKDAPLDERLEVHNICGIGSRTMTNTGWDNNGVIDYEKECGRVTISGYYATRGAAWNIPITVVKKGVPYELTAKEREVPSKICVGTDYHWCRERVDIDDTYHNPVTKEKYFSMYVAGYWNDDDWENGNAWYQQMNNSGQ